jgi:hypothetical protein
MSNEKLIWGLGTGDERKGTLIKELIKSKTLFPPLNHNLNLEKVLEKSWLIKPLYKSFSGRIVKKERTKL